MPYRKTSSLMLFVIGLASGALIGACSNTQQEPHPPRITTTSLRTAKVGVAYSQPLAAEDGVAPLVWSIRTRSEGLEWLTLHTATGELGGTPTSPGFELPVTLAVVDAEGAEGTAQFALTVMACEAGETASCNQVVDGACQLGTSTCDGVEMVCGSTAASADPRWCGPSCTACDPKQADGCTGGVCRCGGGEACAEGKTCCGGACVDLLSDVENCSACGKACDQGSAEVNPRCAGGVCDYSQCAEGYGTCPPGSSETCNTNLRTAQTCGDCATTCAATLEHASLAAEPCPSGTCAYRCEAPWENCNKAMEADGCEINLHTTVAHCGRCGEVCEGPVNGYPECVAGSCTQRCNTETDRICGNACVSQSSTAHCGGCDRPCPPSAPNASAVVCNGSGCVAVCLAGWGDCRNGLSDGCETDLTSADHCGTCGDTACDACVGGQCCIQCGGSLCCGTCFINSKGYEICSG